MTAFAPVSARATAAVSHVPMIIPNDDTARVRLTDPETSHEAADSNDVHSSKAYVLALLRHHGAKADFELEEIHAAEVHQYSVPDYSPSRLRTARATLVTEGLVKFSGEHRKPANRRTRARVWVAV